MEEEQEELLNNNDEPDNADEIIGNVQINEELVAVSPDLHVVAFEIVEDNVPEIIEIDHQPSGSIVTIRENVIETPKTKRRRTGKSKSPAKKKQDKPPNAYWEDEDDGSICPICLDSWEMSGLHRLTSLKCGHLFGLSCIKRWISESHKSCPTCKNKAVARDFRYLYAKKLTVVDKTEENRLRDALVEEKLKVSKLDFECSLANVNLKFERKKNLELQERIKCLELLGVSNTEQGIPKRFRPINIFLEKKISMGRDSDCRVMKFHNKILSMMVSQRSNQTLFPGYGIRFVDVRNFRTNSFIHISSNMIRDITLEEEGNYLLTASREKTTKLYNINNSTIMSTITPPNDSPIWSCCFDQDRKECFYLGSAFGVTYSYDIRNLSTILKEYKIPIDSSPVINILSIPSHANLPSGGFVVCKLKSIWFFEYSESEEILQHQLNVDATFISASYDENSHKLLVVTRPSSSFPTVRYIIGTLAKYQNDNVYFDVTTTINGSREMQMMIRNSLINIDHDYVLLSGYLEDLKLLTIWDIESSKKLQSFSVTKTIYDLVPFKHTNCYFLGGLTESDFNIYKFIEDSNYNL